MNKSTVMKELKQALDGVFDQFATLKHSGKKIIFTQCDSVPYELFAAHGFVVSKLPRWVLNAFYIPDSEIVAQAIKYCSLADLLIVPEKCNNIPKELTHTLNIHTIPLYEGFAEDAVVDLHTVVCSILQRLGVAQEYPNNGALQQAVVIYEDIRKIMRTLTTMYAGAFTNEELQLLCDAAFTLVPEQSVELLHQLYSAIESSGFSGDELKNKILFYSDYRDGRLFDEIYNLGGVIAEDDSCNGRRQFDISCHTSSQNMYYEILYAYSFKSWCPGLRKVSDRIELIYKALPNYDITLVVLMQSHLNSRNLHIQNIYEQCLLQGTDAIILTPDSAVSQFKVYVALLGQRQHYSLRINLL